MLFRRLSRLVGKQDVVELALRLFHGFEYLQTALGGGCGLEQVVVKGTICFLLADYRDLKVFLNGFVDDGSGKALLPDSLGPHAGKSFDEEILASIKLLSSLNRFHRLLFVVFFVIIQLLLFIDVVDIILLFLVFICLNRLFQLLKDVGNLFDELLGLIGQESLQLLLKPDFVCFFSELGLAHE